jgi:hypothetical protein
MTDLPRQKCAPTVDNLEKDAYKSIMQFARTDTGMFIPSTELHMSTGTLHTKV